MDVYCKMHNEICECALQASEAGFVSADDVSDEWQPELLMCVAGFVAALAGKKKSQHCNRSCSYGQAQTTCTKLAPGLHLCALRSTRLWFA